MTEKATKEREDPTPDAPPDVEEAVEEHKEPEEDLSDVDIGLDDEAQLFIVAQTRFGYAVSYQRLAIQGKNIRASVTANESVGNPKGAEEYKTKLQAVELELKHLLRSIKQIDKDYPKAKARMQKMVEGRNKEALLSQ